MLVYSKRWMLKSSYEHMFEVDDMKISNFRQTSDLVRSKQSVRGYINVFVRRDNGVDYMTVTVIIRHAVRADSCITQTCHVA